MMKKTLLIILCISVISLTGCGNERSDNITTKATELIEKVVRNDLFNDVENVIDFMKRLELEETENPEEDGTSGIDLYVKQQKIISVSYVGEYFNIDGKWYVTEDSGAGVALDSMCISFSKTNG